MRSNHADAFAADRFTGEHRHSARCGVVLESLEARQLLAGVTLVTHGFQTSGRPAWLDQATDALADRLDASVYRLVIVATGTSGVAAVQSFTKLSSGSGTNAESIFQLDWSNASNFLSNPIYTPQIATLTLPYLTVAQQLSGDANTQRPFAELPIHLLGHSRGGSLISELAKQLGQAGAWVDQLTPWDAYPVGSDPAVSIGDNIVFADNYYETTDFIVHGNAITGAHNVLLNGLSSMNHSNVHTWYHGTIDRAATVVDGANVPASWYSAPSITGPRHSVGHDRSRFGRGTRPADGVGTLFGGSAARSAVSVTASQPWSNIGAIALGGAPAADGQLRNGDALTISYRYSDLNGGDSVTFWLDPDTNPNNGNEVSIPSAAEPVPASATGAAPQRSLDFAWSSSGLTASVYNLLGRIVGNTGTNPRRFAYLPAPFTVQPDGARVIGKQFTANVNNVWSNANNWTPGGTPGAIDRAAVVGTVAAVGASVNTGSIDVSAGGSVTIAAGGSNTVVLSALSISGAGSIFDLNDNDLIVDYTPADPSPLVGIEQLVSSARAGGSWNGGGLNSTAARNHPSHVTTLGTISGIDYRSIYGTAATFAGRAVDDTSVLVKYTYYGDADFNGLVDFDDYVRADGGFNGGLGSWVNGDSDGSGTVDFDDYVLLDSAFNLQTIVL